MGYVCAYSNTCICIAHITAAYISIDVYIETLLWINCKFTYLYVCIDMYIYIHIHIRVYTYIYVVMHMYPYRICIYRYVFMIIQRYPYVFIHVWVYTCDIHSYISMHMLVSSACIFVNKYAHMHLNPLFAGFILGEVGC
jgi:hypothetical protein